MEVAFMYYKKERFVMQKIKVFGVLVLLSSLMLPFQNCGQPMVFEDAPNLNSQNVNQTTPPNVVIESFSSEIMSKGKIDLIWVVDNSSSMSDEARIVRDNFTEFANFTSSNTDLKIALVSKTSGGNYVTISDELLMTNNYMQVNLKIESHDAPTKLLSVLGNSSTGLADFLREDSTKVLVFVTDDESNKSSDYVLSAMTAHFAAEQTKVFGFIALSTSDPLCRERVGNKYIDMSEATGGKYYDICAEDWSANFSDLSDQINYTANNVFKLSNPSIEILKEVKVNGTVVEPELYSLSGDLLTINFDLKELANNGTIDIEVAYEVKKE